MRPRLLVLGVGRSGTGYAAALLSGLGLRFGHEAVYDYQADSGSPERWADYDGDSSLAAWAGIASLDRPARVLVVLRDPRLVVASFLGSYFWADECPCHPPGEHAAAPYRVWIEERFPEVAAATSEMDRACRYVSCALEAILEACEHPMVEEVLVRDVAEMADHVMAADICRRLTGREDNGPRSAQVVKAIATATRNEHPYHPSRRELLDELLASNWQP